MRIALDVIPASQVCDIAEEIDSQQFSKRLGCMRRPVIRYLQSEGIPHDHTGGFVDPQSTPPVAALLDPDGQQTSHHGAQGDEHHQRPQPELHPRQRQAATTSMPAAESKPPLRRPPQARPASPYSSRSQTTAKARAPPPAKTPVAASRHRRARRGGMIPAARCDFRVHAAYYSQRPAASTVRFAMTFSQQARPSKHSKQGLTLIINFETTRRQVARA